MVFTLSIKVTDSTLSDWLAVRSCVSERGGDDGGVRTSRAGAPGDEDGSYNIRSGPGVGDDGADQG